MEWHQTRIDGKMMLKVQYQNIRSKDMCSLLRSCLNTLSMIKPA